MSCNALGFIALNFVLGVVFRGVMTVALVVEVFSVNRDDRSRDAAHLGVPTYVIAFPKSLFHAGSLTKPFVRRRSVLGLDSYLEQSRCFVCLCTFLWLQLWLWRRLRRTLEHLQMEGGIAMRDDEVETPTPYDPEEAEEVEEEELEVEAEGG